MASEELPQEFDVVVVGTGLTETIVAAALSRIGLKVLHLDRNNYYGGAYANFSLEAIETWRLKNTELVESSETVASSKPGSDVDVGKLLKDGEKAVALPPEPPNAFNITSKFYVRERTAEEEVAAEDRKSKSKLHLPPLNFLQPNLEQNQPTEETDVRTQEDKHTQETHSEETRGEENKAESSDNSSSSLGKIVENIEVLSEKSPLAGDDGSQGDSRQDSQGDSRQDSQGDSRQDSQGDNRQGSQGDNRQDLAVGDSSVPGVKDGDGGKMEEAGGSGQLREWTVGDIKDEWRRFCFDLSPKVLYSSGDLIELLIQSDVARYCEFRTVSRVLTYMKDKLEQVPCSRADLFSSKIVSLIEKRMMMKFLQFAADYEKHHQQYQEYKGKPFVDFLKSKRLPPNINHFVQHAIAMVSDDATTEEGLKSTQTFLHSLGRYGNTAFLFPLYGTGELPQAFARLSAVFGGTYCLMMHPTHIVTDSDGKCCGIITSNGQNITCKYLVAETSYLPASFVLNLSTRRTSRAIYITDTSILQSKEAELSLLNFVPGDDPTRPVILLELPPSACVCPQNLFVTHLTRTAGEGTPEQDFAEVMEKLFATGTPGGGDENKPKILWSTYFMLEDRSQVTSSDVAKGNVLAVSAGGDAGIDLDFCIQEAKCIFNTICPEEEFLPKPPNPEDIIHVDNVDAAVATGPSEYEAGASEAGEREAKGNEARISVAGEKAAKSDGAGDNKKDDEKDIVQGDDEAGIDLGKGLVQNFNIETGES